MFARKKKSPVREFILSTGEKILIRQLTPAERLSCLTLPGDIDLSRRLSMGLYHPAISRRKAGIMLDQEPFRALEILRAIQSFSREYDFTERNRQQILKDEHFLQALKRIETLKR